MTSLIVFDGHHVDILNGDGSRWDGMQEPWFIPKQVAKAIGAGHPSKYAQNILARNPEKFQGFKGTLKLRTPGGEQEVTVINEKGLYMFLFASDLPKAVEFQKRVAELLEGIRKGDVRIEQKSVRENIINEIKWMNAEARLRNANTRQAKMLADIVEKFGDKLSDEAIQSLLSYQSFLLTGERLISLPTIKEKHYTAAEIALELGTTQNMIGRLANKHGLKTREYGIWVLDKSPHSNKQVRSFQYNERGREKLIEVFKEEVRHANK